jgi:NAD(P)-dependent dehydrogenase (short-subunit alcohol dehydrogenase family)
MPTALITGANRGLGVEFARQYLADGWQVYAACRDPESASELRRLADASDHKLRTITLDVTDADECQGGRCGTQGHSH